jgi:hypothetical protein
MVTQDRPISPQGDERPRTTEWGVRWPADPGQGTGVVVEPRADEQDARRVLAVHGVPGAEVVFSIVTGSPWTAA